MNERGDGWKQRREGLWEKDRRNVKDGEGKRKNKEVIR